MSRNEICNPSDWRLSRSGFSIRTGWGDEKKIIASYPGKVSPLDKERYQEWLQNAERICDLHNGHDLLLAEGARKDADYQVLLDDAVELRKEIRLLRAVYDAVELRKEIRLLRAVYDAQLKYDELQELAGDGKTEIDRVYAAAGELEKAMAAVSGIPGK